MRILGIDPGLGLIGLGLVTVTSDGHFGPSEWGTISTSKDKSDGQRLQEIYEDLPGVIQSFKPDCISLERLFFFKNAKTIIPVAQARGVILLVASQQETPVFEYTPMQVKQAITGYGKASKQEVQEMVARILELDKIPRPDDAADGLGLAICHYNHTGRHNITE